MTDITIRPITPDEISKVASFISLGYYDDIFFKWVVADDNERHKIVTDYYKVYLNTKGSVVHVAEDFSGELMGATVWLPHDVDASIYDEIDKIAGIYADNFRAVSDMSHYSEPPMTPFYQLVAVVVSKNAQGLGLGARLLQHNLDRFDEMGIPTYLEASTPYHGGGVYGKFGYQPVGELMVFNKDAVLYPLWRDVRQNKSVTFAGYEWRILEARRGKVLLLSEHVMECRAYHNVYEAVTWAESDVRGYLNDKFYNNFAPDDRAQIIENNLCSGSSADKIFLLSQDEVLKYFGDSGQIQNPVSKFFIDDEFNHARKATLKDGQESRWFLRTEGCTPNFVRIVTNEGKISLTGDFVNRQSTPLFNVGIRPAMWVKKEGLV